MYIIPAAPRLTWSSQDAVQVSLSGLGVVSIELNGSVALCPGVVSDTTCTPMGGSYDYVLRARDANGNEVVRTVTLVVG